MRALRAVCLLVLLLLPVCGEAESDRIGHAAPGRVVETDFISDLLCLSLKEGMTDRILVHASALSGLSSPRLRIEHDPPRIRKAVGEAASCDGFMEAARRYRNRDLLFSDEDFISTAALLGVVRELWWVLPGKEPLPEEQWEGFRDWLRGRGDLPGDFIDSLTYDGTVMRGKFSGLPVRMVHLDNLPSFEEPVLLSLDTSYLAALFENPAKEGMLSLTGWFFDTLRQRNLRSDLVVVSDSPATGGTPLFFRYLAGRLRRLIEEPSLYEKDPPEAWRLTDSVEHLNFFQDPKEAVAEAERLAVLEQEDPYPHLALALLAFHGGRDEQVREYLARAAALDPVYRRGYLIVGGMLFDKRRPDDALDLLRAGYENHPGDPLLGGALAENLRRKGQNEEALRLVRSLMRDHDAAPGPHLTAAMILHERGESEEAEKHLERFTTLSLPGPGREAQLSEWEALKAFLGTRGRDQKKEELPER